MTTTISEVFGRVNAEGNIDILHKEDGYHVTKLDANIYPVNSHLSARYDHAKGITLTHEDAIKIAIDIE